MRVVTDQFAKPVIVSRTGYTGEDGLELIVRAEEANRIWENLLLAGRNDGFIAAGLGARDTLRLEAGMPLYGHELNESIDPLSAGLGFACTLKDRSFLGSEAPGGNCRVWAFNSEAWTEAGRKTTCPRRMPCARWRGTENRRSHEWWPLTDTGISDRHGLR